MVARLWYLPGILFGILSVILNVESNSGSLVRKISYGFLAVAFMCVVLMIIRAASAARGGSRLR
jgi:hypothetical protein